MSRCRSILNEPLQSISKPSTATKAVVTGSPPVDSSSSSNAASDPSLPQLNPPIIDITNFQKAYAMALANADPSTSKASVHSSTLVSKVLPS